MDLKKYISNNYHKVKPYEGVNSIERALLENHFLVVIDNDNNFYGILTASDLIQHPHKIVIDCITKKESLTVDDTLSSTFEKFYSNQSFVLPVMDGNNFVGIIDKNQIIKELDIKVHKLYDKSLISEKAKSCFLNNLSHEIRTPLNGILGFIDIIAQLNTDDFSIECREFSDTIRKSANHFLMIMNDLIELSLLDAGDEVNVTKENVDIIKIFKELKDYFSELLLLQNRKVSIICSNPESSFFIRSDENKLKHILFHLINNAIKFSDDSKVTYGFELAPNGEEVAFFVKNGNSKLGQKDILKMLGIFEKQEKIGNELNFGLGIGLPLVKNMTELLGGNMKFSSKDNEITFSVDIPIH